MDFTLKTYRKLLEAIKAVGYTTQTVKSFLVKPVNRVFVLRHDVDERPENALKMAKLEKSLGIYSTYYFRIMKISNNPKIIKEIAALGHEIGYHYEDFATCNGDMQKAIEQFAWNLEYFRQFYPVRTVCMHGSSMSNFDNREIWKQKSLNDFDLLGEPYLSIDYSIVLYLTDTGRRWDGASYSVRDRVKSHFNVKLKSTFDIIEALKVEKLPDKILLQSHTLWTDSKKQWYWLELREKLRNSIKKIILRIPIIKMISYKIINKYSN